MDAHAKLHPTDQTLSSYSLGKLDDALAEAVNRHLESCPACRRRVAELSSDPFLDRLRDAHAQGRPDSTSHLISSTAGLSMLASGNPSSQAPPPASTLPPGLADHPDYRILRELGQGGMGVVYLAENTLMGRKEVLKVVGSHLINRRGVLERFLVEIRNAARLNHPNVVIAYSVARLGDSFILAMEYVDGLDLARLVKARGPLPVTSACNYLHQAALGLQHAHENGMVHRDIKPANFMLSGQGGRALVKVLDFGLAKVIREGPTDGTLTHQGQMLGTPDFIAPEQIADARRADIRADIYSLGCTLYYLLTAGPPFHGTSLYDILQAHHSTDALPLNLARPEVPVELAAIVGKMMAKEPERRFQEPKQVAQALMPFFKKGSQPSVGSVPEVSQVGQMNASRLVSTATQPATDAGRSAARDEEAAKPTVAETKWESLIDVHKEERSKTPTLAVDPDKRPPWKKWRIAIAGSLFGLIVLGGIIIRILDKEGREIGKLEVPKGGSFVAQDALEESGRKPPEKGNGDTAGRDGSGTDAAGVGGPPRGKPAAADSLQPGTFWRGTSTVLHRSWTNEAAKPQALWLTIKARVGAQFKAVAESPRGWHDAEGTFNDGAIHWNVDKEILSWEGKLVGSELVGTFKGTNRQGERSGVFQLTLADRTPSPGLSARVPPIGPARRARWKIGDGWSVEGDHVIKEGLGDGSIGFGDPDWADYDLTFQALKNAGPHGIGCGFHHSERKIYWLGFGGSDGAHSISHWNELTKEATWPHKRPDTIESTIRLEEWYAVKIVLRGQHIRITLDDHLLFDVEDNFNQRGAIALRFFDSAGRFKNIKVTAPDNTVLWEGPPDLP